MPRCFILPGLGADARMFNHLADTPGVAINFIEWPQFRGEQTFSQVARRVIDQYDIQADNLVGGASLGGIVALEIAQLLAAKDVILLGSAIQTQEINRLLLWSAPLAAIVPIKLTQAIARHSSQLILQMFADSNTDFVRAMALYVRHWPGFRRIATAGGNAHLQVVAAGNSDHRITVHRLHGGRDLMIRCPRTDCFVIEGAGHVPTLTHAAECAKFLALATRKH